MFLEQAGWTFLFLPNLVSLGQKMREIERRVRGADIFTRKGSERRRQAKVKRPRCPVLLGVCLCICVACSEFSV